MRFRADWCGATAIEYAVLGALIAAAVMGAIPLLGGRTEGMWSDAGEKILAGLG